MTCRGSGKAIFLVVLGLILVLPGIAVADQASNKTIVSVINNPTDVIIPPVDTNPTGSTTVITGSSAPSITINVINNGRVVTKAHTASDGTFSISVPIQDGRNVISIRRPDGQSTANPITVTRTPAWWQHWGKTIAYLAAVIVLLLVILWNIYWWWFVGRKKHLFGEKDEDERERKN